MLGNKKDYSAFLCPGAESLALAAPTGTNPAAPGAEPLSVLKACPAPGTGIAGDLVEGMSPEELSRQMNGLADWFRVGFECVDFQVDVKNCGGCAAFGTGYVSSRPLSLACVFFFVTNPCPPINSQDCSALPFAVRSTCAQGSCNVISCEQGYVVAPDKASCIARNDRGTEPILEEEEEERLLRESDAQKVVGRLR
jgi:hypothetical protein